jgi:DNA polymerase III sliding clamp (beta) subunit (PCNA family)
VTGEVDYGKFSFTVKLAVLSSLATTCSHALPAREQVPVFRVSLSGGVLQLAVVSPEQSVLAVTSAVIVTDDYEHVAFVPARKLLAILKEAPAGDMTVAVSGNVAKVTAGKASWSLKLPDGSARPPLPDLSGVVLSEFDGDRLVTAIRAVRHAVCRDAAQPSLTQVAVTAGEDGVVTASDRVRMARAPLAGFPVAVTIPSGVLDDMLRLLAGNPDGKIMVGEIPGRLVLVIGHVTLVTSRRPAQFPDMDKQLLEPALEAGSSVLVVDREELEKAVRRVAIAADQQTSAIALRLTSKGVTVEAKDKNGNSATEAVPATWDDKPRVVVVNSGYLLELLGATTAKSCEFKVGPDMGAKKAPLLLVGTDGDVQVLTRMPAAILGY